jgi:hypothetical protein
MLLASTSWDQIMISYVRTLENRPQRQQIHLEDIFELLFVECGVKCVAIDIDKH